MLFYLIFEGQSIKKRHFFFKIKLSKLKSQIIIAVKVAND